MLCEYPACILTTDLGFIFHVFRMYKGFIFHGSVHTHPLNTILVLDKALGAAASISRRVKDIGTDYIVSWYLQIHCKCLLSVQESLRCCGVNQGFIEAVTFHLFLEGWARDFYQGLTPAGTTEPICAIAGILHTWNPGVLYFFIVLLIY